MPDKQIDISPEIQRINAEKVKRKLELRNEFLKLKSDPFRHAANEGGAVFDPGYLRFQSLNVHLYNFFRPSPKSIFRGLAFFVIPSSVFDPGYLRFQSLNVHLYNFFRPSPKSIFRGLAFFVIPSSVFFYCMYTSRRDREASFRRGEVAYKDRLRKLAS